MRAAPSETVGVRMVVWSALLSLWIVSSFACGGDGSMQPDAGAPQLDARPSTHDGGRDDGATRDDGGPMIEAPAEPMAPAAPTAPSAPEPPRMTPCRAGWALAESGDYCEPAWAAGTTCADDEALFVGERDCTRIGTACGADGWPTALPTTGAVIFVRAGAAGGGDGSRDAPFATIGAGLAAADDGVVVAVAEGRYVEDLTLPAGVTVWGACVARTTLVGDDPLRGDFTVGVAGAASRLRNLRLEGARMEVRGASASVELTDVLFERVHGWGFRAAEGAQAVLRGVVARDAGPTVDGPWNQIYGGAGAQMVLERVVVERCDMGLGMFEPGSTMEVRDVVVRDTAGEFAFGMNFGATLMAEGLVIDRADFSFMVSSDPSLAILTDVLVRDSVHSIVANYGARLEATRVTTIRGAEGPRAELPGSQVVGTDLIVRDTENAGLLATNDATLTVTRAHVVNAGHQGLVVRGSGIADVTDLDVSGSGLPGVEVQTSGRAHVTRARLTNATGAGVRVEGETASAELDDVMVESVQLDADGGGGVGVAVSAATVSATQIAISGAHETGVHVSGPTGRMTASDIAVNGTTASTALPASGRGVEVIDGGGLVAERMQIDASAAEALFVGGGGSVNVPDVAVDGAAGQAAVRVVESSTVVTQRAHVGHATSSGVAITGASFTTEDLLVRDVGGDGIAIEAGATVGFVRTAFDAVASVALRVDVGGEIGAEVADVSVTHLGRAGIVMAHAAPTTLLRVNVQGDGGVGVVVSGRGTIVTASDVRIGDGTDASPARGIEVARGARWTSTSSLVLGSAVCVVAVGAGSDAVLRDAWLDGCGLGASVSDGASLELDGFLVSDASIAGLQVGERGSLDLRQGDVRGNAVGANVQDATFDVRRLTIDGVVFSGNGTDVSVDALEVPGPTSP